MAAACGSIERIFDNPLPENQTFLESLSPWKLKPDSSSFTEIFGELHFKENNEGSASPDPDRPEIEKSPKLQSESLSVCTEGLGFESSDRDDQICGGGEKEGMMAEEKHDDHHHHRMDQFNKRSRICRSEFPPPISCIGRSGKPWVCFKSYREEGRFILKEMRIPTHEFLHACRADGRLRLQFISDDEDDDQD